MIDFENIMTTLKETWPFALVLGTHVVRTEASRAVIKNRLKHGENNFARVEKKFDQLERQIEKTADEMRRSQEIISADIKHLLERDR